MVGMPVGAIGPQREDHGRAQFGEQPGELEGLAGRSGETTIGEAPVDGRRGAKCRTGTRKLAQSGLADGRWAGGAAIVAFTSLAGGQADDDTAPAGAGREGDGSTKAVGLVVGVRDDGDKGGHKAMLAGHSPGLSRPPREMTRPQQRGRLSAGPFLGRAAMAEAAQIQEVAPLAAAPPEPTLRTTSDSSTSFSRGVMNACTKPATESTARRAAAAQLTSAASPALSPKMLNP